jgi:hypothetical protein
MTSWGINILKLEGSILRHLDVIFSHHGVYAIMGFACLCVLLLGWVMVDVSRRKAKGLIGDMRPVVFIELPSPPPRSEPENPFPPRCDCDRHHDR